MSKFLETHSSWKIMHPLLFGFLLIFIRRSYSSPSLDENVQYNSVCPSSFQNVGRRCYHFSNTTATWFQAFFSCKDLNNSNLTVLTRKYDQGQLEKFLFKNRSRSKAHNLSAYWVGGFKDWKQKKWVYTDGAPLQFPRDIELNAEEKWTCLLVDSFKKRWRAENCMARRPFMCETEPAASVSFKVEKKIKRKITIDQCIGNTDKLTNKQKKKCLKMLDSSFENGRKDADELDAVIQKPAKAAYPTQPTTLKAISHICPQSWMSLGNQCYLLSKQEATWSEAHFNCGQINARLAMIRSKAQDQKLRIFLNGFTEKQERWIGGRYNDKAKEWIWALNGKPLKYQGFAKEAMENDTLALQWKAIVMDPQYGYQWNYKSEMEKHNYICQVKGRAVKRLQLPRRPSATIEILPDPKFQRRTREYRRRSRSNRKANRYKRC